MTDASTPSTLLLAGVTGDLGGRVASALAARQVPFTALLRRPPDPALARRLDGWGATAVVADHGNVQALAAAMTGADTLVSLLSGLAPVIVEAQGRLLDAAVAAGVRRFIPSDYAVDFTRLAPGGNRNLDLRLAFRERLVKAPIRHTSILNGAFADMLVKEIPIIRPEIRRVLYWHDADQPMDFTTIDDTAAFTARVAADRDTPELLTICGDRISARGLAEAMSEISGTRYQVQWAGSLHMLKGMIAIARWFDRDPAALYPAWQGMQYMHTLFSGQAMLPTPFANDRYPGLAWTDARGVLRRRWGR